MASLFKFTKPNTNTVSLNSDNQGKARQSVTNESGRALQAITRLEINPPDSPAKDWIRVQPEGASTMKVNGTMHYDIIVEVPDGETLDEPVSFKLIVADEFNPEDNFADGPDMIVAPQTKAEKPRRLGLIIAAIVAALVVVGIVIAIIVLTRPEDDTARLEVLADIAVYLEPDTGSEQMTSLSASTVLPVTLQTSDGSWYQVTLENSESGWVRGTVGQVQQIGTISEVALFVTSTPTLTPTPTATNTATATFTPTGSPTPTATWTPSATNNPTLTPSDTPTPTPEPSTMSVPFGLVPNTVDYYILVGGPGTIRVNSNWRNPGFQVSLGILILDSGDNLMLSAQAAQTGSTVEYPLPDSDWSNPQVWRISISNRTGQRFFADFEISYPGVMRDVQSFRDQNDLDPAAATANFVVPLSRPGEIQVNSNWNNSRGSLEASIRLPNQRDAPMASQGGVDRAAVTYTVPDLSISNIWIVSLAGLPSGSTLPGSVTIRYP